MTSTPERVADAFVEATGRAPEGVWSAPGRVNLIGEHTDYNDGFALPFALAERTLVAAGRRCDGRLAIRSVQQPGEVVDLPLAALRPGRPQGWAAYVAGVVWALQEVGHALDGLDVLVDGGVPVGSGLSSSAAIECATAIAVADLAGAATDPAALARLAQHAENDFVGMPCGVMDQMASMTARAGHVLFLDARTGAAEQVPFDPSADDLVVLVMNTHVHHALADGAYAERRASCHDAARRLGVPALRDVPEHDLAAALARLGDSPTLCRRVRHVVTEDARVLATVELLRAGAIGEIGPLLTASHASMRDDFEISVPELDTVVDAALSGGALGARMTGGGFGGSAIALVPVGAAAPVAEAVVAAAQLAGHPTPTVWAAVPSRGAHLEALHDPATTTSTSGKGTPAWQR